MNLASRLTPAPMNHPKALSKQLLALMLFVGLAANGWAIEPPTLYVMNSPQAKARIEKGFFRPVFRGFGPRTPLKIAKNELLGFRFLFDTDCLSFPMRDLVNRHQAKGMTPEKAFRQALIDHIQILKKEFTRMDSTAKLYENFPGKGLDVEQAFLFTTPHLSIARCYGPVVLVIEEARPRGLDLNGIARDAKYYSFGRFLSNISKMRWKTIAADYVLDRDEYVIPSFIPRDDITGIIVHGPSKLIVAGRLPVVPPKVLRVYRKHYVRESMVIDVFDAQDRLIERLSATPWSTPIDPKIQRSPEKLPAAVAEAWRNHVAKRRRKAPK